MLQDTVDRVRSRGTQQARELASQGALFLKDADHEDDITRRKALDALLDWYRVALNFLDGSR